MIVAGTGHRPDKIGGYGHAAEQKRFRFALEVLREVKPDEVISGMALGWDMALARAAIFLRIPLTAAVPFVGQEKAWPEGSQELYKIVLDQATTKVIVSEGGYAGWKMQRRNEYMVIKADKVVALFDGVPSGGTFNCVKYAEKVNKPILNVWDQWQKFSP